MRDWVVRATVESALIIASILLALAVDEWREDQQNQELANQALFSFARELRQNRARIQDVAPYHAGLRQVLARLAYAEGAGSGAADLRSVVEGLEPTVLLSSAWETALATGALNYMGYETVSALSLTYSLQSRFEEYSRSELPSLNPLANLSDTDRRIVIRRALSYVEEVAQREQELLGVYGQALRMIAERAPGDSSAFAEGEDEEGAAGGAAEGKPGILPP